MGITVQGLPEIPRMVIFRKKKKLCCIELDAKFYVDFRQLLSIATILIFLTNAVSQKIPYTKMIANFDQNHQLMIKNNNFRWVL